MKNISKVPQNDNKFGEDDLVKAPFRGFCDEEIDQTDK